MNVSLTPELEQFVQTLVASGRYHSASEVFREGLRLLEQAERQRLLEKWLAEGLTPEEQAKLPPELLEHARETVNERIRAGLNALARGEAVDGEAFFARWRSRLESAADSAKDERAKRRA